MRRSLSLVALVASLIMVCSCATKKPVAQAEKPLNAEVQRPSWVQGRPITDAYYVGIGLCPKGRTDFIETAKKNALNDLASEISVKVEGNSLLHTLDSKQNFKEEFTSTINTRTSEQLEGFELVDTWENGSEYWTYYRLSKAEHARIKAEKKQQAITQATDLFARSKQSLAGGDLRSAFDQDLRALIALKDHWGESDQVLIDGKLTPLANAIFSDLQTLTSGVRLSALPERCELNYGNHFQREMLIRASFAGAGKARDLNQLPLFFSYPGLDGNVTNTKNTDVEGLARTTVQRADLEAQAPELLVRLDVQALVSKDLDAAFTKPLVGSLTVPELHVPIDRAMPKVFFTVSETNLGQPVNDAGVASLIQEELTRRGFRAVSRATDADLVLDLKASTREGGESNGFFTTFLDLSFTFRDRRSEEVVYQGGRQGVKGIQLNYAKAGLDAYKKAAQTFHDELVPAMLNALL
ncbi:MAG TPA: LPP20 family lipoprotein [Flavobacteriales bacterium]